MNKLMGKTFRLAMPSFLRPYPFDSREEEGASIRHSFSHFAHKHFGSDQPGSFISNLVMEGFLGPFLLPPLHRNWILTLNCVSTPECDIWSPEKLFRPPLGLEASCETFFFREGFFTQSHFSRAPYPKAISFCEHPTRTEWSASNSNWNYQLKIFFFTFSTANSRARTNTHTASHENNFLYFFTSFSIWRMFIREETWSTNKLTALGRLV